MSVSVKVANAPLKALVERLTQAAYAMVGTTAEEKFSSGDLQCTASMNLLDKKVTPMSDGEVMTLADLRKKMPEEHFNAMAAFFNEVKDMLLGDSKVYYKEGHVQVFNRVTFIGFQCSVPSAQEVAKEMSQEMSNLERDEIFPALTNALKVAKKNCSDYQQGAHFEVIPLELSSRHQGYEIELGFLYGSDQLAPAKITQHHSELQMREDISSAVKSIKLFMENCFMSRWTVGVIERLEKSVPKKLIVFTGRHIRVTLKHTI